MSSKQINVAVAVIVFDDNNANINANAQQVSAEKISTEQFLLGYRNAKQHQGERYEFVGGKIEVDETALAALIREVDEEIGLALTAEQCAHMGDITHDYTDKVVCLHVFKVSVSPAQYQQMADKEVGSLNQPLLWADKADLLAGKYPLPEANAQIFEWLK